MRMLVGIIIIFIVSVFVIEMFLYAYKTLRHPERRNIRRRLKTISSSEYGKEIPSILHKRVLSDVPLLNKILLHIPGIQRLDLLIRQANVQDRLAFFILLSVLLALIGLLGCSFVTRHYPISVITAALLGGTPFLYLSLKKKKRMQKFQRQLPEALDLIARALRAGHAFTSGMKLAAEEFDDPLGTEFDDTLDEINFGVSVPDALKNLANRVDCTDLKYFIVSVILQRETGGNLAEIMESIAHIIRERFKFENRVRTLTAEGRLSAKILIAIPFLIVIAFRFLSPEYTKSLLSDPNGRIMVGIALLMMMIGILIMKRMADIKV